MVLYFLLFLYSFLMNNKNFIAVQKIMKYNAGANTIDYNKMTSTLLNKSIPN